MTTPSIVSVNVGLPRNVEYGDRNVTTGIFKIPVEGRVIVGSLGLQGDGQADLTVHGGPQKAVYVYQSEHYESGRMSCRHVCRMGCFSGPDCYSATFPML